MKNALTDITIEYLRTNDSDLLLKRIEEFNNEHFSPNTLNDEGRYPETHGIDDDAFYHLFTKPLMALINEPNQRNKILEDMKIQAEAKEYKDKMTIKYYQRDFTDEELQEPEYWEKEFNPNQYTKYIHRSYFE
jgi:hypothetical protein